MKNDSQTVQSVKAVTEKEVSLRKILNLLGIFIFIGSGLTSVTHPVPEKEIDDFLLFIIGSATLYYFLVNIFHIGQIGRKICFITLILLLCSSLYMVFYLLANTIPH